MRGLVLLLPWRRASAQGLLRGDIAIGSRSSILRREELLDIALAMLLRSRRRRRLRTLRHWLVPNARFVAVSPLTLCGLGCLTTTVTTATSVVVGITATVLVAIQATQSTEQLPHPLRLRRRERRPRAAAVLPPLPLLLLHHPGDVAQLRVPPLGHPLGPLVLVVRFGQLPLRRPEVGPQRRNLPLEAGDDGIAAVALGWLLHGGGGIGQSGIEL
mmetsp:Transcript_11833/g.33809  ORF Transcript_11833/g.33809 Transcript_11833/m.33809 type:complete len:215 (+) Transcript_11833:4215-4859(+)